jgi:hypothetical protein
MDKIMDKIEEIERDEWTQVEITHVGLYGGTIYECVVVMPDGHLDTVFGSSRADVLATIRKIGAQIY